MIDWHEIARTESVIRLGEMLRRQFNVWVGFVGTSGIGIPIGANQPVDKALCSAFMSRRDGNGSCHASLGTWMEALAGDDKHVDGPMLLECHAALKSLVVPIRSDKTLVGACYISGFAVDGGDAEERTVRRGAELELGKTLVSQGNRALPRVTERELRLFEELGQMIADEAMTLIGRQKKPDQRTVPGVGEYGAMIGQSATIEKLFRLLDKVCRSDSTVLIQGEPGVGKELVAKAIHFNSARGERAIVVQNCSALNDSLLDSELFGHKRGAFTGAIGDKQGLFELADRGTFFLDEIGDMSAMLQVKLLRVLQEGTFLPVGDTVMRKVDVRIIAATNRDLRAMVKEGTFRNDLYYRLNVITVHVPSLRERLEDVPQLVEYFLVEKAEQNLQPIKAVSKELMAKLVAYDWPGNVRELENEVERLVVLSGDVDEIPASLLSPRILKRPPTTIPAGAMFAFAPQLPKNLPEALENLERHMILESLKRTNWNKTRTAKELGISRRNLIRKVDRFKLDTLRPDESSE
ncbi:MAG: hypothetical protein AUK47_09755 [Deltaproteobacteria bacterium CG2_30_63_29]|nr:MAG: hypothetical protein AUK47_09755 [Deltaproteobacteria bacterium CG2_30_63_29]PJB40567.1 MAG: hypothetical protein CO108_14525 [Deltaproteobacteria bacterium CG_4_9_14_3_um_filter_63_12]